MTPYLVKITSCCQRVDKEWVGTGSLVSRAGYILTNAHVILDHKLQKQIDPFKACTVEVQFSAQPENQKAELVTFIPTDAGDIALLKVENIPAGAHPIDLWPVESGKGQSVELKGYPSILKNDESEITGVIDAQIRAPESIFANAMIEDVFVVKFNSNVFTGYSGGALYAGSLKKHVGILSFYHEKDQLIGYCITAKCIRRLLGDVLPELRFFPEDVSVHARVFVIHGPGTDVDRFYLKLKRKASILSSQKGYKIAFSSIAESGGFTGEGRMANPQLVKKACREADAIAFITDDLHFEGYWYSEERRQFSAIKELAREYRKKIIFLNWNAKENAFKDYLSEFEGLFVVRFPDSRHGIIDILGTSIQKLEAQAIYPNYSIHEAIIEHFHEELVSYKRELFNRLLDFDFDSQKFDYEEKADNPRKYFLCCVEGSRRCGQEILINYLRKREFGEEQNLPAKIIAYHQHGVQSATDLWQAIAQECFNLPRDSSPASVMDRICQKLNNGADLMVVIDHLFSASPDETQVQAVKKVLSDFWEQLSGQAERLSVPSRRFIIFVINRFYDYSTKKGSVALPQESATALVKNINLSPIRVLNEKSAERKLNDWRDMEKAYFIKEQLEACREDIISDPYVGVIVSKLCRFYDMETYEKLKRI